MNNGSGRVAYIMGITADYGFAAGSLCVALTRYITHSEYDILILADPAIPVKDREILESINNVKVVEYTPEQCALSDGIRQRFSLFCLAKLRLFSFLKDYETVIWLDADMAVQGDISQLRNYGPMSMALEDPAFTDKGTPDLSVDFLTVPENLSVDMPHYNSGVLVLQNSLTDPEKMENWCITKLHELAPVLKHPDQAIFNLLIQEFPDQFTELPFSQYNCHPKNADSLYSAIVHAFGDYKFWDDGLVGIMFPEWRRDYARWLAMGGSRYSGPVQNIEYFDTGIFQLVSTLYDTLAAAENGLATLEHTLAAERNTNKKLTLMLERLANSR